MRHAMPLLALLAIVGCSRVETTKDDDAAMGAMTLTEVAKVYTSNNEGAKVKKLDELAVYMETGQRALIDPWGAEFQFKYVEDKAFGRERLVVWTTNPTTGKKVGWPKELLDEPEKK